MLLEPSIQVEVVVLLAPQHAGQRLAMHPALIVGERLRRDPLVEFVGVGDPALERLLEAAKGLIDPRGRQTEADGLASAGGHVEGVVGGRLGAHLGGVDRLAAARDGVGVERVLDVRGRVGLAPETGGVALVLGEEQLRSSIAREPVLAELVVGGLDDARPRLAQRGLGLVVAPGPGVAEPERRQDAKPGRLRPAVVHGDANENVLRALLRVLHEHVEVPIVVEGARVEQLVLELLPRSPAVRLDQVPVGILPLRVLVEVLHVRVGGRAVDVEVVLLDVLAVVRLTVGEPEQALLQDGIPLVPQRQRQAQPLLVVREAREPVLAPPVGARAGLVMGEVVPGVAVVAVVLADRAPLPLAEVGSPLLPGDVRLARLVQPLLLGDVDQRLHSPSVPFRAVDDRNCLPAQYNGHACAVGPAAARGRSAGHLTRPTPTA